MKAVMIVMMWKHLVERVCIPEFVYDLFIRFFYLKYYSFHSPIQGEDPFNSLFEKKLTFLGSRLFDEQTQTGKRKMIKT